MSLKDEVVLVTGSSGGMAMQSSAHSQPKGPSSQVRPRPEGRPGFAGFFPLDTPSEEDAPTVVRDITTRYGRIDALVHAAGVLGTTPDIMKTTTEEFDFIMRINGSGTFSMVRETAQSMIGTGTSRCHRDPLLRCSQRSPPQLLALQRKQTRSTSHHVVLRRAARPQRHIGQRHRARPSKHSHVGTVRKRLRTGRNRQPGQARRATSHAPVRRTGLSRPRHPFPCRPEQPLHHGRVPRCGRREHTWEWEPDPGNQVRLRFSRQTEFTAHNRSPPARETFGPSARFKSGRFQEAGASAHFCALWCGESR